MGYTDDRLAPTPHLVQVEFKAQRLRGFTSDHDARHVNGELIFAAQSYILRDASLWPWPDTVPDFGPRDLVKAAALLEAEAWRQAMERGGVGGPDNRTIRSPR